MKSQFKGSHLIVQDEVWGQASQLEFLQDVFFVGLIFLSSFAIKLTQEDIQAHLKKYLELTHIITNI